jgi:hypothetical protein
LRRRGRSGPSSSPTSSSSTPRSSPGVRRPRSAARPRNRASCASPAIARPTPKSTGKRSTRTASKRCATTCRSSASTKDRIGRRLERALAAPDATARCRRSSGSAPLRMSLGQGTRLGVTPPVVVALAWHSPQASEKRLSPSNRGRGRRPCLLPLPRARGSRSGVGRLLGARNDGCKAAMHERQLASLAIAGRSVAKLRAGLGEVHQKGCVGGTTGSFSDKVEARRERRLPVCGVLPQVMWIAARCSRSAAFASRTDSALMTSPRTGALKSFHRPARRRPAAWRSTRRRRRHRRGRRAGRRGRRDGQERLTHRRGGEDRGGPLLPERQRGGGLTNWRVLGLGVGRREHARHKASGDERTVGRRRHPREDRLSTSALRVISRSRL